MNPRRFFSAWLVSTMVFCAFAVNAETPTVPFPGDVSPEFKVGYTVFTTPYSGSSTAGPVVIMQVWYPVNPDAVTPGHPRAAYELFFLPADPYRDPTTGESKSGLSDVAPKLPSDRGAFDGQTTALPVSDRGPFPLIVYAGGNGQFLDCLSYGGPEVWASHGFVVVAPHDNIGDGHRRLLGIGGTNPQRVSDRVMALGTTLDTLLAKNTDPADAFFGTIDPAKIGIVGASLGGITSMRRTLLDARIKAISVIAPVTRGITDEQLAQISLPTMVVFGTDDGILKVDVTSRPFTTISTPEGKKFLVGLVGARHMSTGDACRMIRDWLHPLTPFMVDPTTLNKVIDTLNNQGCLAAMPGETALRLANLYFVSFFKVFLTGDGRYEPFLTHNFAKANDLPVHYFTSVKAVKDFLEVKVEKKP